MSYLTLEAIKASNILDRHKINCEIIDLISLKPLNIGAIIKSLRKTKRLLVLDTGFPYGSVASEIISQVTRKFYKELKSPPEIMTMPDIPEPTSYNLTKNLYINHLKITKKILKIFKKKINLHIKNLIKHHDVPGEWFKGPF
jgi:pyruvate dehydrogenase E1 component beta subunit